MARHGALGGCSALWYRAAAPLALSGRVREQYSGPRRSKRAGETMADTRLRGG
jgi:hypothetical protein